MCVPCLSRGTPPYAEWHLPFFCYAICYAVGKCPHHRRKKTRRNGRAAVYLPMHYRRRCNSSASFARVSARHARIHVSPRHMPCVRLFALALALPAAVRGPVLRSHGFHRLMASACLARASSVHRGMVNSPFQNGSLSKCSTSRK
ncbi:hypothetical protein ACO3_510189 [Thiomonas arsenitoxydans]|nr:hypothetical protein ACO3_510189 [Thiomonas arsenitoxydans]